MKEFISSEPRHAKREKVDGVRPIKEGRIEEPPATGGIRLEQTVTVLKSPEELYTFWRNWTNHLKFMKHLIEVQLRDDHTTHWVMQGLTDGSRIEYDALLVEDLPNQLISWRSAENADVNNAGTVTFRPAPKGTEVKLIVTYNPPAGRLGSWIAQLLGEEPGQRIREDLRHFKQLMETGEISTIEGQSVVVDSGRTS